MLEWTHANRLGGAYHGMAEQRLVGSVVRYDVPAGWQGFLSGYRVDGGPWDDVGPARAAVEAAWAASSTTPGFDARVGQDRRRSGGFSPGEVHR